MKHIYPIYRLGIKTIYNVNFKDKSECTLKPIQNMYFISFSQRNWQGYYRSRKNRIQYAFQECSIPHIYKLVFVLKLYTLQHEIVS